MTETTEFIVVSYRNLDNFNDEIDIRLKEGYEISGELKVSVTGSDRQFLHYTQAMVKRSEEPAKKVGGCQPIYHATP